MESIRWDEAALGRVLAESAVLRGELDRIGVDGAGYAKSIAPVLTGKYADAFIHSIGTVEGIPGPVLCIANTDFKAWWVERGTVHHQGGHVLDRTLDHLRR